MIRFVLAAVILSVPLVAQAQTDSPDMSHGAHGATMEKPLAAMPIQPGQGAFAAIQEIVSMLDADSTTDWSKVNIARLRRHLVDMNNVTLHA